jgi:hypothetical protein
MSRMASQAACPACSAFIRVRDLCGRTTLAIDYQIVPGSMRQLPEALLNSEHAHVDSFARFVSAAPFTTRHRVWSLCSKFCVNMFGRTDPNFPISKGLIARRGSRPQCVPGVHQQGPRRIRRTSLRERLSSPTLRWFSQVGKLKDELDKPVG